jgi:hypothetical protein
LNEKKSLAMGGGIIEFFVRRNVLEESNLKKNYTVQLLAE